MQCHRHVNCIEVAFPTLVIVKPEHIHALPRFTPAASATNSVQTLSSIKRRVCSLVPAPSNPRLVAKMTDAPGGAERKPAGVCSAAEISETGRTLDCVSRLIPAF